MFRGTTIGTLAFNHFLFERSVFAEQHKVSTSAALWQLYKSSVLFHHVGIVREMEITVNRLFFICYSGFENTSQHNYCEPSGDVIGYGQNRKQSVHAPDDQQWANGYGNYDYC